ncbi:MAG: hypothetical protein ACMUEL_09630 [Flavobacteriales bacterium Tduv]
MEACAQQVIFLIILIRPNPNRRSLTDQCFKPNSVPFSAYIPFL